MCVLHTIILTAFWANYYFPISLIVSCRETVKKREIAAPWKAVAWLSLTEMEWKLHLSELFKVIYKFCTIAKNWTSLWEYPAHTLVTEFIFFFIANGSPKKLSGNTLSLEGWMEKEKKNKKRVLVWEEKQTKPSNNLHYSLALLTPHTLLPWFLLLRESTSRIAEGYKWESSLIKVISFTGAGGAEAGIVFASLFQCS